MPQSLTKIYLHIIFSTKYRKPMIDEAIENELFRYLGGCCKELDCQPVEVGGYLNHVHILCRFSKKITIMKLLEEIKKSSSRWIKTIHEDYSDFYWQDGYAAFSVDPDDLDIVRTYILNQKEHHRKTGYEDECRMLFKKHGIDFDERYVWD